MISLTPRQRDLLAYLESRRNEPVGPTVADMGAAVNLKGMASISADIDALEDGGWVRRLPHKARAIEAISIPVEVNGEPYRFIPKSRAS